ncbi:hypothetical protein CspHIS471_0410450 [Cutaneotrichosporon sp. HIS471]|nr:hypothetical protein CspHIS471_0410450 [Cutaneotrichosporon sp. HIS471]
MTDTALDATTSAVDKPRPTSAHSASGLSDTSAGSEYSPELATAATMQDISLDDDRDADDFRTPEPATTPSLEDELRVRTPEPAPPVPLQREPSVGSDHIAEHDADAVPPLPAAPGTAGSPFTSPRAPGRSHARNISTASAASALSAISGHSRTTTSSVAFEEIGFDDGPGWTEAPEMALPQAARMGAGPPIAGGFSPIATTDSPSARSDHTIVGAVTPSKRSTAASFGTLGGGLGLRVRVRDADVPLVLGVAVVDFNHLIGPTVEFAHPASLAEALAADDELSRLLPFLALPDGAHLSEEDYSYFHCAFNPKAGTEPNTEVPWGRTIFGISCNRQIAASDLLRKSSDVTRSMVQKAVVVLASQPVFGPVRDRLGVVTRTFFAQRDFGSTQILNDFYESLEAGLEGKAGESAIYMGTSLRELVHKFRHRTLVLLKMLLLQKRIMLYGYPVEMLCTYQYSLVSLVPGLLMNLRDCGSPMLDARTLRTRPTSLRTSDRASLLRYMGLPLHLFGADAVFQPYLPLQQMDMLQAHSWLVGTTNQIVTQQRDCKYDLLIQDMTFEFPDHKVERLIALTAADRKWMDDIVKTVEDSWNLPEGERPGFLGSDDDLRNRFEEYLCAFLASIKYADFIGQKGAHDAAAAGVGAPAESNPLLHFGEAYTEAFRQTPAYELWDSTTDEVIFDLTEPRHPMEGKVSAFGDVGIRLAEGLHDLKIEESLAPTRAAMSSAFAAGSSSLFRAFDGVRSEVNNRLEAEKARRASATAAERERNSPNGSPNGSRPSSAAALAPSTPAANRPESVASNRSGNSTGAAGTSPAASPGVDVRATLGTVGSSISGFFGSRMASFSRAPAPSPQPDRRNSGLRPMSLAGSAAAASPKKPGT